MYRISYVMAHVVYNVYTIVAYTLYKLAAAVVVYYDTEVFLYTALILKTCYIIMYQG